MSTLALADDEYLSEYNSHLEEQACMKKYRDDLLNGSIAPAHGPPLPLLKGVPQYRYMGNHKNQHQELGGDFAPIEFWVRKIYGTESLVVKGLKLTDAIRGNMDALLYGTDQVQLGKSTKVTIRLRVVDDHDYSETIPSCRATVKREWKERAMVAEKVAAIIERSMPQTKIGYIDVRQWHINGDTVRFEELILLELRHVTAGSWQPVLVYPDPAFR